MKARSLFRGFSRSFFNRNSAAAEAPKNNFYEILGVAADATDTQIKHAYFKLAKTHHPDVKSADTDSSINFELINEAYQTLKNPQSRKLYDRTGLSSDEQNQEGVNTGFGFGLDPEEAIKKREEQFKKEFKEYFPLFQYNLDNMDKYFEQEPVAVDITGEPLSLNYSPSPNIELFLKLNFKEFEGKESITKTLRFVREVTCSEWDGTLVAEKTEEGYWEACEGEGRIIGNTGESVDYFPCKECHGTGNVLMDPWDHWDKTGFEKKTTKLQITIPAGIKDGEYLRIKSYGNSTRDNRVGDLFIKTKVEGVPNGF